ncbi:MAG TPA: DEAD/DEAH box helicase [Acidobacteriaceae bacterium]
MFDPVTAKLLQAAPPLEGLNPEDLPAMLTRHYAELVAHRLRTVDVEETEGSTEAEAWPLSKIADAYEIVASIHGDPSVRRSAAFVAATANQILFRQLNASDHVEPYPILDRERVDPSIAAAILFLAAEQYADAHEAAATINPATGGHGYVATILAEQLRDLALGNLRSILERGARWRRPGIDSGSLEDRATNALFESLTTGVEMLAAFLLAEPTPEAASERFDSARAAFERVLNLSTRSSGEHSSDLNGELLTSYPGPRHLAALLIATYDGINQAALTHIPPPAGADAGFWRRWLAHRAETAPFVWSNHRLATDKGFHETGNSAVMVLPTGAGKTTVSGLKIAAVLARGKKVVFLAPTHALVDQLTEDLQQMFPRDLIGSIVSSDFDLLFATGSQLQQIEVMTPERCLALLSFAPEAFGDVGLLVFDECHLLSPQGGNLRRSLDGMFCVLAFNSLAPTADFLFLSAMLRNGEEFSRWIGHLTGRPCVFVDPLWKPSRQARGVVLYERGTLAAIRKSATAAQLAENRRTGKNAKTLRSVARKELVAQPYALFGLQHNWLGAKAICTIAKILGENVPLEGSPTAYGIGLKPNVNHVAARLAAASVKSGLKTIVFVNVKSHAISTAHEIAQLLGHTPIATEEEEARWNALKNELGGLEHSVLAGPVGAVPHNAMMLRLERDLAERLFRRPDGARVIVATPTLAQGLNLPAHFAILAGDKRADPDDGGREALEAHEILNAAARAGRAGHLANGVVLLIPEDVLDFGADNSLSAGLVNKLKSILPEDDRCVDIEDPLQIILDRITVQGANDLDVEYALNRLSTIVAPEGAESKAVVRFDVARSFAAFSAAENDKMATFEARIARLNDALGRRNDPPHDAALLELAVQSGAPFPVLENLRNRLKAEVTLPGTIEAWVSWIIEWLSADEQARLALLEREKRSIMGAVGLPKDEPLTADAMERLGPGVLSWIKGEPLKEVEKTLGGNPATAPGRLCPRARTLATNIAPLGLSFIGGLVARAAKEAVAAGDSPATSVAVTDCLATAIRRGFDSPAKVAFAELKTRLLSRVDVHTAFAADIATGVLAEDGVDYSSVKANVAAFLSFMDNT